MFASSLFIFLITLPCFICTSIYNIKLSSNDRVNKDYIKAICDQRHVICKGELVNVCAVRKMDDKIDYKDFNNTCYVFIGNLCIYPGKEFYIITSGTCEEYLISRRNNQISNSTSRQSDPSSTKSTTITANSTTTVNATTTKVNYTTTTGNSKTKSKFTTDAILRNKPKPFSVLYEVDTSFDGHICPLSCQDTYDPVCVNVNRQYGLYFKYLTFINHCHAYLYYCKNHNEFKPPPDVDYEMAVASKLGWSYCGASRYLQFSRFSEVLSSLGHYGWLAGDQGYSHIMEPHERIPGYG